MAYAIMRCAKKSSMGAVARSLKHCYREAPTPNADPTRTHQNEHLFAKNTDEAMGRLRELLPEKRRKDAVVCVEYLMTASPEWWKTAPEDQRKKFFYRAEKWLAEKYGEQNIVTLSVHKDETSPHVSAFVAPLTADGRLSAKEFIGNKTKMSEDQTTFAEKMKDIGLERGIKGSKARHQTIREYYALANSVEPLKTPEIHVPDPKLLEGKAAYGNRVAQATLDAINPAFLGWQAKATAAAKRIENANKDKAAAQARERDAKNLAHAAQIGRKNAQDEAEKLREKFAQLQKIILAGGEPLKNLQESIKQAVEQRQNAPKRSISR